MAYTAARDGAEQEDSRRNGTEEEMRCGEQKISDAGVLERESLVRSLQYLAVKINQES